MSNRTSISKVVGFGLVGILNTVIDYAVFNLIIFGPGVRPFVANFFSTSAALTFSYFMNKRYVFKHAGKFDAKSAALFFGFTAFGLWIIQGVGLALIVHWTQTNLPDLYAEHEFLVVNGAKLVASVASIAWNFTTYNSIVFKKETIEEDIISQHRR